jgi:single-strand DNA-binding protein
MYNKVTLIGRVGKEIEMSTFQAKGETVSKAKTSLATGRGDKTTWFNLEVIGKRADAFGKYTRKGALIFVEGEQVNNTYTNKEGETKNYSYVRVTDFGWLESNKENLPAAQGGASAPEADDSIPF